MRTIRLKWNIARHGSGGGEHLRIVAAAAVATVYNVGSSFVRPSVPPSTRVGEVYCADNLSWFC